MSDAKTDTSNMTSDEKLDFIIDRLKEGDRRFGFIEADISIAFNWMKELAMKRGREDIAAQIEKRMEDRAAQLNGAGHDSEADTITETG